MIEENMEEDFTNFYKHEDVFSGGGAICHKANLDLYFNLLFYSKIGLLQKYCFYKFNNLHVKTKCELISDI